MDILTNKQYKSYDRISRYALVPIYFNRLDNRYMMGTVTKLVDSKYKMYKVQENDTYDSLALDYYNNPTLYWVICNVNGVFDPFTPPTPGEYIKIPILSEVTFE